MHGEKHLSYIFFNVSDKLPTSISSYIHLTLFSIQYALGYRKGVTKRFGEKLFDIMDSGEKTDEELLQLIHSYHKEASVEIVKAEELERNNNPNYGKEQSISDATSESETQNQ